MEPNNRAVLIGRFYNDLLLFFDRYMDMDDENQVIQLKSCPRCSTPIRTSLRYGNVIKQRLQDIEKVKVRAHGHPREMDETRRRLQTRLADLESIFNGENEMTEWRSLERSVERMTKGTVAAVTENQVTLMERFCVMNQKLKRQLLEPSRKRGAYIRQPEGTYVLEENPTKQYHFFLPSLQIDACAPRPFNVL